MLISGNKRKFGVTDMSGNNADDNDDDHNIALNEEYKINNITVLSANHLGEGVNESYITLNHGIFTNDDKITATELESDNNIYGKNLHLDNDVECENITNYNNITTSVLSSETINSVSTMNINSGGNLVIEPSNSNIIYMNSKVNGGIILTGNSSVGWPFKLTNLDAVNACVMGVYLTGSEHRPTIGGHNYGFTAWRPLWLNPGDVTICGQATESDATSKSAKLYVSGNIFSENDLKFQNHNLKSITTSATIVDHKFQNNSGTIAHLNDIAAFNIFNSSGFATGIIHSFFGGNKLTKIDLLLEGTIGDAYNVDIYDFSTTLYMCSMHGVFTQTGPYVASFNTFITLPADPCYAIIQLVNISSGFLYGVLVYGI